MILFFSTRPTLDAFSFGVGLSPSLLAKKNVENSEKNVLAVCLNYGSY